MFSRKARRRAGTQNWASGLFTLKATSIKPRNDHCRTRVVVCCHGGAHRKLPELQRVGPLRVLSPKFNCIGKVWRLRQSLQRKLKICGQARDSRDPLGSGGAPDYNREDKVHCQHQPTPRLG